MKEPEQSQDQDPQTLIYWNCKNEHLWARRQGPLPETSFMDQLHEAASKIGAKSKQSYLLATANTPICPHCGNKMFMIEVRVNVKFNLTQTSQA